jgi:hypothetical protein
MMVAETLDDVRSVMVETGSSVGLLLDTGHAAAGDFDYARLIEEYAPRINHIHLKDVRADVLADVGARGRSFNDGVCAGMFTVPGEGSVDFGPLARFLATGTYSGWLVVAGTRPSATSTSASGPEYVPQRPPSSPPCASSSPSSTPSSATESHGKTLDARHSHSPASAVGSTRASSTTRRCRGVGGARAPRPAPGRSATSARMSSASPSS